LDTEDQAALLEHLDRDLDGVNRDSDDLSLETLEAFKIRKYTDETPATSDVDLDDISLFAIDSSSTFGKLSAAANSVSLDGDLILDFSDFDDTALSSLTQLDLIVADAIEGQFDSESVIGLEVGLEATIEIVDFADGAEDVLRVVVS
jgi:hypothetical protein